MRKKLIGHKIKYVSAPSLAQTIGQCIQIHPEKKTAIERFVKDCEAQQELGSIADQEIQLALLVAFPHRVYRSSCAASRRNVGRKRS